MLNLARTLVCVPVPLLILVGLEAKELSDFQGRRVIIFLVRWNLRPVTFGVELFRRHNPGPFLGTTKETKTQCSGTPGLNVRPTMVA